MPFVTSFRPQKREKVISKMLYKEPYTISLVILITILKYFEPPIVVNKFR